MIKRLIISNKIVKIIYYVSLCHYIYLFLNMILFVIFCHVNLKYKCRPTFFTCVPTRMTRFAFQLFVKIWFLEKDLESLFILIFFKRENKMKKENPIWLLIWKRHVCKNRIWIWGQVTYWESMVVSCSTPLSSQTYD